MPIYNVTPAGFDHVCDNCKKESKEVPHTVLQQRTRRGKTVLTYTSCDLGGELHIESFNDGLGLEEETSETRDEASREQVRNVRLLYKHAGLR